MALLPKPALLPWAGSQVGRLCSVPIQPDWMAWQCLLAQLSTKGGQKAGSLRPFPSGRHCQGDPTPGKEAEL